MHPHPAHPRVRVPAQPSPASPPSTLSPGPGREPEAPWLPTPTCTQAPPAPGFTRPPEAHLSQPCPQHDRTRRGAFREVTRLDEVVGRPRGWTEGETTRNRPTEGWPSGRRQEVSLRKHQPCRLLLLEIQPPAWGLEPLPFDLRALRYVSRQLDLTDPAPKGESTDRLPGQRTERTLSAGDRLWARSPFTKGPLPFPGHEAHIPTPPGSSLGCAGSAVVGAGEPQRQPVLPPE